MFALLLLLAFSLQSSHSRVQIIPTFAHLPPAVTPFLPSTPSTSASLACRVWPPNAWLGLVADTSHGPALSSSLPTASLNLGRQLFAIQPAGQSAADNHTSLLEAIRSRPAALSSDEVSVHLTVDSLADARRLELTRLHCMAATPFGRLLSRPFRLRVTSLADFAPTPPADASSSQSHSRQSPSSSSSPARVRKQHFLHNNIAYVECRLPPVGESYPPPRVQFEFNQKPIDVAANSNRSEKYHQIAQPDGQRVFLLIRNFGSSDVGTYQCTATNPLTMQRKHAPEVVELKLIQPMRPVDPTIAIPLAHQSISSLAFSGSSSSDSLTNLAPSAGGGGHQIVVREGQNVTLFCVIQSAPPPKVTTYPHDRNLTSNLANHPRFLRNDKFGFLQITNVQPSDAGNYVCSNSRTASTAVLVVKPRLSVKVKPQIIRVGGSGNSSARFTCSSSDPDVTPYWLFNGQPKPGVGIGQDANLLLTNVSQSDLGLYQCVAHRWTSMMMTTLGVADDRLFAPTSDDDDWASAVAILASESDQLIRTPELLAPYTNVANHQPSDDDRSSSEDEVDPNFKPSAEPVFDNLAVLVTWPAFQPPHSSTSAKLVPEYRIEYSILTSPLERIPSTLKGRTIRDEDTANLLSLVGLRGHDAVSWSDSVLLSKYQTPATVAYVFGEPLQPSRRYRFRVTPIDPSSGLRLSPTSAWSNVVGLDHISLIDPPEIETVKTLSNGDVHVEWRFSERQNASSKLLSSSDGRQTTSRYDLLSLLGHPAAVAVSTSTASVTFRPSHFLLLARSVQKPWRRGDKKFKYGNYVITQVNGSDVREGHIRGLNRSSNYQIIVYAVRSGGSPAPAADQRRQITQFSKAVYVNLLAAATDSSSDGIAANPASSNSLGFNLMTSIANNRLLYIIIGSIVGIMIFVMILLTALCLCRHRDPIVLDSNDGMDGKKPMPNGYLHQNDFKQPPNNNNHGNCGGGMSRSFDLPMPNNAGSQIESQHPPSYQPPAPPLMLHQHPHHQSHQSLLLSPVATNGVGGGGGMLHHGTLPPANRMQANARQSIMMMPLRGGSCGPQRPHLGSQMMLVSAGGGGGFDDNASLRLQHTASSVVGGGGGIYARHPPQAQLPPVPPFYYQSGPMTPSGGPHREPSIHGGGGSVIHDGSAYGTLVHRGGGGGQYASQAPYHQHLAHSTMMAGNAASIDSPPQGFYSPQQQHHFHASQQALHQQQQQQMMAAGSPLLMMSPNAAGSHMQLSPQQQQQQGGYNPGGYNPVGAAPPMGYNYAAQQQALNYGSGGGTMENGNGLAMASHSGFAPTDGESVYSYFSQPQQQQDGGGQIMNGNHQVALNSLPEEGHPASSAAYVDSGMQTGGNNNNDTASQQQNGHRHHRRRRRKPGKTTNGARGDLHQATSDDERAATSAGEGQALLSDSGNPAGGNYPPTDNELDGIVLPSDVIGKQQHQPLLNGSSSSHYASHPPSTMLSMDGRLAYAGSPGFNQVSSAYQGGVPQGNSMLVSDPNAIYQSRHHPNLPPPNQPPPPPPPPPGSSNGGLLLGVNGGGHPTAAAAPPPRIRDYSEYGIPRGIGLPAVPQHATSPAGVAGGHYRGVTPLQQQIGG